LGLQSLLASCTLNPFSPTVSGAVERGLPQNDVSPGERLQFLQFSRSYLGGDKAASDSYSLWNSAGYEQELQHRESLQQK
jgi:hypothetical protein